VHIGLRVDDAAAVHGRLAAAGFAPLSPPRTLPDDGSGWSGSIVFYVRDPDGVMLEFAAWTKTFNESDVAHEAVRADGTRAKNVVLKTETMPA